MGFPRSDGGRGACRIAEEASDDRGVGGKVSRVTRFGVFDALDAVALFSVLSSRSESTSASRRDTRSRRFFLWSTTTSELACSWSMQREPRAKHSEQTSGLSGGKMHLILRRRPVLYQYTCSPMALCQFVLGSIRQGDERSMVFMNRGIR